MSFAQPSFIATALLGRTLAAKVTSVRSETNMFGSTTGPYGGFGGAAMSVFTITELGLGGSLHVYFADERFLGWSDEQTVRDAFPRLRADMPYLNTDQASCPVDLSGLVSSRYADAKSRIDASLTMGISAEADNPNLEAIVSTITPDQVDWIAAWLAGEGIS